MVELVALLPCFTNGCIVVQGHGVGYVRQEDANCEFNKVPPTRVIKARLPMELITELSHNNLTNDTAVSHI
jgi:hypothetical protein